MAKRSGLARDILDLLRRHAVEEYTRDYGEGEEELAEDHEQGRHPSDCMIEKRPTETRPAQRHKPDRGQDMEGDESGADEENPGRKRRKRGGGDMESIVSRAVRGGRGRDDY